MRSAISPGVRRQQGLALVVALVLLLVMTMIAVVAMRSTTLDLKMTSNTTLKRRAFESSESARLLIGPVVGSHCYFSGWPADIGGTVDAANNFTIPTEVEVQDVSKMYFEGTNGTLAQATAATPRDEDIRFRADVNGDGLVNTEDVFANVWVSWIGNAQIAGSAGGPGVGTQGPGSGSAIYGAKKLFDIRAIGQANGNAAVWTSADYRYVPH